MVEHRRDIYKGAVTEATYTRNLEYRLKGNQIEIGYFPLTPCPPNANCMPNFLGVLFDSKLALTVSHPTSTTQIVYLYTPAAIEQ
jgi:hypothetical protein